MRRRRRRELICDENAQVSGTRLHAVIRELKKNIPGSRDRSKIGKEARRRESVHHCKSDLDPVERLRVAAASSEVSLAREVCFLPMFKKILYGHLEELDLR